MKNAARLAAQLRVAWTRKLVLWWQHYNVEYLHSALRVPLIEVVDVRSYLGRWHGAERRLVIAVAHIENDSWLEVLDTLRHEMAHQFVDEGLAISGESPHGPAFRKACEKMRCSPRAQGASTPSCPSAEDRLLQRLRKVLSLSQSPNENEAEVAVAKARHMLLRYNVDVVSLDAERHFGRRSLGPAKGRRASYELWLSLILQDFFFVETIWAETYIPARNQSATVLEIYGTDANIEMAAYVYDYLTGLMEPLWVAYRRAESLTSNRERQRYWSGILEGFYRKLREREAVARKRNEALVRWQGDEKLRAYYRYVNPHVRVRYGRGVRSSEAYQAGLEKGRQVEIRRPLEQTAERVGGYLERA
tara:strand:+ start:992 stop:2074 length:1083 start_codon:yes stop_codon:yes gene_type:complete